MALVEIPFGGMLKSVDVNANFEYLEEQITISAAALQNEINAASNNVTSLGNTVNTLTNTVNTNNTSLQNEINAIKTNASGLSNTSLSNINATGKANILNYVAPNYSAGYSISSGWTAPKAGWVYCEMNSSANGTTKVLIGGKAVAYNYQGAGDGRAGALKVGCLAFIAKGQALTTSVTGSPTNSFVFYPCKGN